MLWAINQPLVHAIRHLQGKGSLPGDMAQLCLEAGDEARQQPEEEMQAARVAVKTGKGNERVTEKRSKAGRSHWSLNLPDALFLLQDPEGCQLPLSGENWLLAEMWRKENTNLLLTAEMRREQAAGAGFQVGCGCQKQGDSGQGGKSSGGAGILSPLGDRLMWTGECSCAYKSQKPQ